MSQTLYHFVIRDDPPRSPQVDVYYDEGGSTDVIQVKFSTVWNNRLPRKVYLHAKSMLYAVTAKRRTAHLFQLMKRP